MNHESFSVGHAIVLNMMRHYSNYRLTPNDLSTWQKYFWQWKRGVFSKNKPTPKTKQKSHVFSRDALALGNKNVRSCYKKWRSFLVEVLLWSCNWLKTQSILLLSDLSIQSKILPLYRFSNAKEGLSDLSLLRCYITYIDFGPFSVYLVTCSMIYYLYASLSALASAPEQDLFIYLACGHSFYNKQVSTKKMPSIELAHCYSDCVMVFS